MAVSGTGKFVKVEGSHGMNSGIIIGNATANSDTPYFNASLLYKELANGTISKARFFIHQTDSSVAGRFLLNFPNLTRFYVNGYLGFTGTIRVAYDFNWPLTPAALDVFDGNATYANYTFKNGLWIS